MYTGDGTSLEFDGVFNRHKFTQITRRLYGQPVPRVLSLDLEHVDHAYATAVVPLISLVKYLKASGTRVEITYPFHDTYWEIAGWKQLLEGWNLLQFTLADHISRFKYTPIPFISMNS